MGILILLGQKLVLQILHIFPERGNVRAEDNLIVYRQGLEDGLDVLGKVGVIFRHPGWFSESTSSANARKIPIENLQLASERGLNKEQLAHWCPAGGTMCRIILPAEPGRRTIEPMRAERGAEKTATTVDGQTKK